VRELVDDIGILTDERELHIELTNVEDELEAVYRDLDSDATSCPDISRYLRRMKELVIAIDQMHSTTLGSIFRSGTRQTFFAMQAMRYADLYAASCLSLINYPFSYFFRAKSQLMPHETAIEHEINEAKPPSYDKEKAASPPRLPSLTGSAVPSPLKNSPKSQRARFLRYQSFTHDEDDEDVSLQKMPDLDEYDGCGDIEQANQAS
jgi:5'-nucleotidase